MSEQEAGMSFQQRVFLTVALCLGIWMVFDLFSPPPPPPSEGDTDGQVQSGTGGEQATESEGAAPSPQPAPSPRPPPTNSEEVELVEHRLSNDLVALDVSNGGWGLIGGTELLGAQFAEPDGTGLDFLLIGEHPTLELGFAADETSFAYAAGNRQEVVEKTDRRFVVRQRTEQIEVVQSLELLEGYELSYEVALTNLSTNELRERLHVRNRLGQPKEESRYNIHRALCNTLEDLEEYELDDLEEGPERLTGGVTWAALTSQYFVHALVPVEGDYGCEASTSSDGRELQVAIVGPDQKLAAGETVRHRFGMYMGAKNQDRLAGYSVVPGVGLENSIDWGWFGGLSRVLGGLLFDLLQWIHALVGIWGVSIIILTAIIKVTTLPLTLKQMNSMKRMREIQPEIEKVKKKYGSDRAKQSQEMQALFQRTGVNPLAGCLPMLVQMPIWFALYSMLSAVVELYHEDFLWLSDLTAPDPYFVLPLGMGVLMFIQTRIQPTAADNQQAKLMQWMMPGIFTVMMLFMPSGLGVYIFANIVLSLIQTFIQLRPGKKSDTAAAK